MKEEKKDKKGKCRIRKETIGKVKIRKARSRKVKIQKVKISFCFSSQDCSAQCSGGCIRFAVVQCWWFGGLVVWWFGGLVRLCFDCY